MRSPTRSALVSFSLVLVASGAQAVGTVQVNYLNPDKFADIGLSPQEREDSLKHLTRHFEALAKRYLADGQKLSVDVLDVDLAGELRPSRRAGRDLRVLNGGADWPRITLRYAVEGAGQMPLRGEEKLADMNYSRRLPSTDATEALHAEKRMLEDWFAARLGPRGAK